MNQHFSYKNTTKTPDVERIISRHVDKINRLLEHFSPDLVHLHGTLEIQNPREGFTTSLNLRLPVGQVHSTQAAKTAGDSMRAAFDDLERQINKEKELLRGNGKHARAAVGIAEAEAGASESEPHKA
jgi:ribosome-associated translation inhibitor RaiA